MTIESIARRLAGIVLAAALLTACAPEASTAAPAPSSGNTAQTSPAPAVAPATPLVRGLPDFATLVEQVGPAVVNVTVLEKRQRNPLGGGGSPFSDNDPFSDFFRQFQNQQQRDLPPEEGVGSGFIVSSDGYILTNTHVVDNATRVTVRLTDRREFQAKVIGSDDKSDVALIKIDATNLPTVRIGDPSKLRPGEWVVAIGSPFNFQNSVTAGIVSAIGRPVPGGSGYNYVNFIQTDVAVNPGNSGGPLFNMNGEVVGINSQIFSESGGFQGISFAIPIDIAINVKDQLIAHGKVTRARIGVTIQDVNQQLANSFKLPRPMGALVSDVDAEGPGAKAGLKSGDVITKLDGREIDRSADLPARVATLKPGSTTHLEVWRGGKPVDIAVSLGELKDAAVVARADTGGGEGRLGVAVRPLRPEEAKQLGSIANGSGLVVEESSGAAAEAGIQAGDVILSFNGQPVQSADQLKALIAKSGGNAAVLVQRGRNRIFVPVELG
jgi:serine protease Do